MDIDTAADTTLPMDLVVYYTAFPDPGKPGSDEVYKKYGLTKGRSNLDDDKLKKRLPLSELGHTDFFEYCKTDPEISLIIPDFDTERVTFRGFVESYSAAANIITKRVEEKRKREAQRKVF